MVDNGFLKKGKKVMPQPSNIMYHELIGLKAEVIESKNKGLVGISGKIVDETKNTIKIIEDNKEKTIIKNQAKFKLKLPTKEEIEVDGKLLVGKPESRIKKQILKKRV